jgi:hypothetical protein
MLVRPHRAGFTPRRERFPVMKKEFFGPAMAMAMVVGASSAMADIIYFTSNASSSTEQTGASFDGLVEYNFLGGNSGEVTVSLTNTTDPGIGGFITGFVFNINSVDPDATASLTSGTNSNFVGLQNVSAQPFGMFDAGAAVSGDWEGGGSPAGGIGLGQTASFVFSILASDASSLSAISFLTGSNQFNFVGRMRGVGKNGEDSDKIPVVVVPAPMSVAVFALAGLMGTRRRRS